LGLYQLKSSFDDFYDTKYESAVKLNQLNTLYISNDLKDSDKKLWLEFKKYDFSLNRDDQRAYKRLIRKTDKTINDIHALLKESKDDVKLQSLLNQLHQNFSKISTFVYKKAEKNREFVNQQYYYTVWMLVSLTIFLLLRLLEIERKIRSCISMQDLQLWVR